MYMATLRLYQKICSTLTQYSQSAQFLRILNLFWTMSVLRSVKGTYETKIILFELIDRHTFIKP